MCPGVARVHLPTVEWDKVIFRDGLPHILNLGRLGNLRAITLPDALTPALVRVFFAPGQWDPCSCAGLQLIVHEGFHVLKFMTRADTACSWSGRFPFYT